MPPCSRLFSSGCSGRDVRSSDTLALLAGAFTRCWRTDRSARLRYPDKDPLATPDDPAKSLTRDSRSGVCTLNGCRPSGSPGWPSPQPCGRRGLCPAAPSTSPSATATGPSSSGRPTAVAAMLAPSRFTVQPSQTPVGEAIRPPKSVHGEADRTVDSKAPVWRTNPEDGSSLETGDWTDRGG